MRDTELIVDGVVDALARENFDRIQRAFKEDMFGRFNGVFVTIIIAGAVTNMRWPHQLRFRPQDVIQTSLIGAGALTWNYALFSATHLDITTTGACTVRAFVGSYVEN